MFRTPHRLLVPTVLLPLLCAAQAASASTLLLDDFAAPVPAISMVAPSQNFVTSQAGSYAGVAGQFRAAYYFPYASSTGAAPGGTAQIGQGTVTVAAAPASIGELELGYGAYGAPPSDLAANGTNLNLDLSAYNDLQLRFASLAQPVNVIVGFYTSKPVAGSGPLYYLDAQIQLNPAADRGPVSGDVLFKGADSSTPPSLFNFSQVDGMVVIVDRASAIYGNSYSLTSLSFTQAVPEPGSVWMLLGGMLFIGWRGSRRAQRAAP